MMISQRQIASMEHIQAGRYDQALALVEQLFAEGEYGPSADRSSVFMNMFDWTMLAERHQPAVDSLRRVRDQQASLLFAGDFYYGEKGSVPVTSWPRTARLQLIRDMNETLGDSRSTYDIFVELESRHPDEALYQSWRVLPALVRAGDFTRADRYCGDPLEQLAYVNQLSKKLPLFAPHPLAPRLAAELGNLVQHARLGTEILAGLGRTDEATALHAALIDGLESDEIKHYAQREFEEPGTLLRLSTDRTMAECDGDDCP